MADHIKFSSSTPIVEIGASKRSWSAVKLERRGLVASLEWSVFATLALFIVLGFGLRVSSLGGVGFAEDEMNKLNAVRSYSCSDIVYMLAAVGVMTLIRYLSSLLNSRQAPAIVPAIAVVIFIVLPASTAYANGPHFALYTNAFGAGLSGYFFPHEEFYDDGLREAIRFVCDRAPQGAVIAHETSGVTRYYLEKLSRSDLRSHAISAADFDPAKVSGPAYIIAQRGRTYFENQDKIAFVRANFEKVHIVSIKGVTAAEVFVNPIEAFRFLNAPPRL